MNIDITSQKILNLLRNKHEGQNDLFFSELNTGSSTREKVTRMDAWTMPRSWSNPECTAYEIKVSRSDFKKDEKWQTYLPYCNYIYFVCPPGVIPIEDVPPEAGLYVTSTNGTRLFKKKIAMNRKVDIPIELFRLALMRSIPSKSDDSSLDIFDKQVMKLKKLEKLEDYVMNGDIIRERGHQLSLKIQEIIKKQILDVKAENKRLENIIHSLKEIEQYITSLGITRDQLNWGSRKAKELILEDQSVIPPNLNNSIQAVKQNLAILEENIRKVEKLEKVG
ncbi:MAG: MmcB family DNA repair protein [Leptospira sp.]|nr:MmcB family DNA repair protein [Leptospira sp.]